jgi:WD40 repeat protein
LSIHPPTLPETFSTGEEYGLVGIYKSHWAGIGGLAFGNHSKWAVVVAVSSDERMIAVADGQIRIWYQGTGVPFTNFEAHSATIHTCSFARMTIG